MGQVKSRGAFYAWLAFLGVLVAMGIYGAFRQTVEGHVLTGTSRVVPWGIYIAGFVFFVGCSAGATIIGLMTHAFGRHDYKPLGTRAIIIGILSLMAAVLMVAADVGVAWKMVLIPWVLGNPTSMFFYTSLTYYLFGIILLAELWFAVKITRGRADDRDKKVSKWLAIIAVPVALWVLHAPHGTLFGVVQARELWHSPLIPPHFASLALASGTSLVMLMAILTSKLGQRELVSRETLSHMGKLLPYFIIVTIFFDFFDFLILGYQPTAMEREYMSILTGSYGPFVAFYIGGMVIALLILLKWRKTIMGLAVASSLVLLAAAAYRYYFVIVGQLAELVPDLQGLPELRYSPTGIETAIVVGIVALVLFLYTVLTRVLPMEKTVGEGGGSDVG